MRNTHLLKVLKFYYLILAGSLFLNFSANASLAPTKFSQAVISDGPHATQVGIDILNHGGNAIDAAVAVGYALAVTHPCCGNIGGGGFMLIHLANGKDTVINFREKAPQAISPKLFFDKNGNTINSSTEGYLAVGIPGTVLGLNTALKKYGTLPLQVVMQPAIQLANQGFNLTPSQVRILSYGTSFFQFQFNVAAIFLKNGNPLQSGDKLIQKDLGKTLALIAEHGSNIFYHGEIANKIVQASQQHGGVITAQDLANYTVEEQQPITCEYRGYKIITNPPPGSGATVCEILNITNGYSLHALGFHTAESAHYILEAMRYAYADRNTYLGDPDFIKIPLEKLTSADYAKQIRQQINPFLAGDSKKIGFLVNDGQEHQDTAAYAVADKLGNIVVVTYTINDFFGAKVIADNTGFFLNDELDDFTLRPGISNMFGLIQGKANLIAPNKRPLSAISPVIITKDNQFFMALATAGGSTIPTQLVEAIENVIDYKMTIKDALNATKFHMQWLPDIVYIEPFTFSLLNSIKLNKMNYHFQLGSPWGSLHWGSPVGIIKNPTTQILEAAAEQ